jgi:hypothetical protein
MDITVRKIVSFLPFIPVFHVKFLKINHPLFVISYLLQNSWILIMKIQKLSLLQEIALVVIEFPLFVCQISLHRALNELKYIIPWHESGKVKNSKSPQPC